MGSQNSVKAVRLATIAASAVNIGQNLARVDADRMDFDQMNRQYATADVMADQSVANYGFAIGGQTSNNASVQLTDSQNNVSAVSIANVASAANMGQNLAAIDARGGSFTQTNDQTAFVSGSANQEVTRYGEGETNNDAAIHLANSQNHSSALSIVNAAFSAVNASQNIVNISGRDVNVNQVNCQTASSGLSQDQNGDAGLGGSAPLNRGASIVLTNSQMGLSAPSPFPNEPEAQGGENGCGCNSHYSCNVLLHGGGGGSARGRRRPGDGRRA